jgi:hypothetical protein
LHPISTEETHMRSPHTAPLLVLGLALWIAGGVFNAFSREGSAAFGVMAVAGIAALVTGVVLHLRAGGR